MSSIEWAKGVSRRLRENPSAYATMSEFPELPDELDALREQLRRAQLLTPESALAMCESKWGPHDKKLGEGGWYWVRDGKMCAILTTNDDGMSFNVAWEAGDGFELKGARTHGQLEDAIREAKGDA